MKGVPGSLCREVTFDLVSAIVSRSAVESGNKVRVLNPAFATRKQASFDFYVPE